MPEAFSLGHRERERRNVVLLHGRSNPEVGSHRYLEWSLWSSRFWVLLLPLFLLQAQQQKKKKKQRWKNVTPMEVGRDEEILSGTSLLYSKKNGRSEELKSGCRGFGGQNNSSSRSSCFFSQRRIGVKSRGGLQDFGRTSTQTSPQTHGGWRWIVKRPPLRPVYQNNPLSLSLSRCPFKVEICFCEVGCTCSSPGDLQRSYRGGTSPLF